MLHFESMCLCFNDRNGKKNIFVFFLLFSSVPSNSAHMKTEILSHSFSCGYEKQVVCFKLFFFVTACKVYSFDLIISPSHWLPKDEEKKEPNICDGWYVFVNVKILKN